MSRVQPGAATVLVVEDRTTVRDAVAEVVRSLGYRVYAASSAAEALEVESGVEDTIDVLLTDVVMPGMNGPELASQLRRRRTQLRVVYLTAYAADALEGVASQHAHVIYKPTSRAELAKVMARALSEPAVTSRSDSPLPPLPTDA